MTADDEDVPRRVREAEERRAFRELLLRSSLGCACGHFLSEHDADGWRLDGTPVGQRCQVPGCGCGEGT